MNKIHDCIIIGSGPAGFSAAVYAKRACLDTLLFEEITLQGGQIVNTYEVDNYLGIEKIDGYTLSQKFRDHALRMGLEIISKKVIEVDVSNKIKIVKTKNEEYQTKTIIFATGAIPLSLGVKGENEFKGKGVSYCATCDGAFFKEQTTMVVGGGDVAVEDAIFLSRMCKKVYLVHRRDELRATKILQEELFSKENVEVIWDSIVEEIKGKENLQSVIIKNKKTNENKEIFLQGIFCAIGTKARSELIIEKVDTENGYIIANEDCITSIDGIFAAGDVRKKPLRQLITAASDGANAISSVEKYLLKSK
ncbi:MAG: thioredoxin-disulfide reductase [Eubacteriales bacterium]|nr:thioredoxin-disulfide reductase [Eubacteriales bacterium]